MTGLNRKAARAFFARTGRFPRFAALVGLCLLAFSLARPAARPEAAAGTALAGPQVVAVHDGDTVSLRIDGRVRRCRLIGIDAPEMGQEPWGRRAREHLEKLVRTSGGTVSVERDVEEYDKYGRLLVYLWSADRVMINERMLRDGYAVLFTIQPNSRHVDRFIRAQRDARTAGRGIWGPDGLRERPLDYKKTHPRDERRPKGLRPG